MRNFRVDVTCGMAECWSAESATVSGCIDLLHAALKHGPLQGWINSPLGIVFGPADEEETIVTEAWKDDADKARTDLIPPESLLDAAKVLAFGAQKYGERNWEQGMAFGRVYGALLRHVLAWWGGENNDPETGEPHLAHAMCCMLMLHALAARHSGSQWDDRP